jgi:hypothetical protein
MNAVRIAVIALCLSCCCCNGPSQPLAAELPEVTHIKTIHVIWDQTTDGKKPPANKFDVVDHFDGFINAITPNRVEPHPLKWEGGCQFMIELDNGGSKRIDVYWPARETLAFRISGTYYIGGSKHKLNDWLRDRARK